MRVLAMLLSLITPSNAEEGMWTFDRFPADKVQQSYGISIDQPWLDHVRLSSVRLAQGCSASFVSAQGLVLTNHHCARTCITGLSDAAHDYVRDGFIAAVFAEERRCPALEVDRLEQITDVTREMHEATAGRDGDAFREAETAAEARLQSGCSTGDEVRCDVVRLYAGGVYALYIYHRFQDVRLAWSPEDDAANFGGDPDNFEFPRYDLDAALLRVYDGGAPLATPQHLRFATAPIHEGDFVVTSGNPGSTSRDDTIAQLIYARDWSLPRSLIDIAEERGMLAEFAAHDPERQRMARNDLFGLSNSYKALFGQLRALADPVVLAGKAESEAALRRRVAADPGLAVDAGAWDAIAAAQERVKQWRDRIAVLQGYPRTSRMMSAAIILVRRAAERTKPNEQRLRGYTDADDPALRQAVLSSAPVYAGLEEVKLRYALGKMRERLAPDDPLAKRLFDHDTIEDLARDLAASRLADPAERRALLDGGAEAIAASTDPMIAFVRDRLDGPGRAVDKMQGELGAIFTRNATLIAQARFALDGDRAPPDATFSPRLSFGAVRGYEAFRGGRVAPFTTFAGAFAHQTGAAPFMLPQSWTTARAALEGDGHLDLASTNDIIGGNSGSPLIDAAGELVGLVFDGNLESLGGDYVYDGRANRTVSVSVDALWQALRTIYRADRLVKELSEP